MTLFKLQRLYSNLVTESNFKKYNKYEAFFGRGSNQTADNTTVCECCIDFQCVTQSFMFLDSKYTQ